MLICRRCRGQRLVELGRLHGSDHPIYRCRDCGFLFSPPEDDRRTAHTTNVRPSAPRPQVWRAAPTASSARPVASARPIPTVHNTALTNNAVARAG